MNLLILALLWLAWCFLHSLFASALVKRIILSSDKLIPQWYRLTYNLLSIVGFALVVYFQSTIDDVFIFEVKPLLLAFSETVFIVGFILMLFSLKTYNLKVFAGINKEYTHINLVVTGLNKWIRHPLYVSIMIMLIAWFFIKPVEANAVTCSLLILYLIVGSYLEEKRLKSNFGQSYSDYMQRTGMWFPKLTWMNKRKKEE